MNGAMAELWAKMMIPPRRRSIKIIGIIHQSFIAQRKPRSSPAIENFIMRFFNMRSSPYFSMTCWPSTSTSMPLRLKVLNASAGVLTIGSPLRLKEVLSRIGMPVASPNVLINW